MNKSNQGELSVELAQPQIESTFNVSYRRYALMLLVFVSIFNAIDRTVFIAVMEPIKAELGLSDTQLGLLSGLAFSLFYATMGLPFSRWADLGNRRNLLTLTVGLWSLMTALTGMAQNFIQLFLARVGVGIGEGGGHPAALSMLSDLYPAKKGGHAISFFLVGGTVGGIVGIAGGSAIAAEFGWRIALVALGVPGLILALIIRFSLREPRQNCRLPTASETFGPEFKNAAKTLLHKKSFFYCLIGFTIFSVYGQGSGQWTLSYILRNFDISHESAGGVLGLALGGAGIVGTVLGGFVTNYVGERNVKGFLLFPVLIMLISVPIAVVVYLSTSITLVFSLLAVLGILTGLMTPCIFALVFGVSGVKYKAMGMALLGMLATLIGSGLGPMFIGAVSDILTPVVGSNSLKYALLSSILFVPLSTYFFIKASHTIEVDFENDAAMEAEPFNSKDTCDS